LYFYDKIHDTEKQESQRCGVGWQREVNSRDLRSANLTLREQENTGKEMSLSLDWLLLPLTQILREWGQGKGQRVRTERFGMVRKKGPDEQTPCLCQGRSNRSLPEKGELFGDALFIGPTAEHLRQSCVRADIRAPP
jgi:hypothetical protein